MIDCDDLRKDTEKYWKKYQNNATNEEQVLRDDYISDLLPHEMVCIERPSEKQIASCKKLVFLVGHSVEPLLQSVCAYCPKEILLVINERYGAKTTGRMQADMVEDLIDELHKKACPDVGKPSVACCLAQGDHPAAIYQTLQMELKQTKKVILDITGAKKSMVAGAFLFAALAHIPISYVDFPDDAYSPRNRRPYGYKAQIRLLSNPFTDFALQEWERVRSWYRNYKFRDARRLLAGELDNGKHLAGDGTILETMRNYIPGSEKAILQLAEALYCYELWDAGDYNAAKKVAEKITGFQPPAAVSGLGDKWYVAEVGKFIGGFPNFYLDTPEFRTYIFDELARIDRLRKFNQDYRSVLLRAGSLNEIVMLARLVKYIPDGEEKEEWLKALQKGTPNAYEVFDFLKRPAGQTYKLREHIWQYPKTMSHECPDCGNAFAVEYGSNKHNLPDVEVSFDEKMTWYVRLPVYGRLGSWKTFLNRRNDLAHKYFSPPPEWARDAFEFVEANVEDLWPGEMENQDTETMPWSNLCRLVGLQKYLPPNLLEDAGKGED